jgi:hypothetical protein
MRYGVLETAAKGIHLNFDDKVGCQQQIKPPMESNVSIYDCAQIKPHHTK